MMKQLSMYGPRYSPKAIDARVEREIYDSH